MEVAGVLWLLMIIVGVLYLVNLVLWTLVVIGSRRTRRPPERRRS